MEKKLKIGDRVYSNYFGEGTVVGEYDEGDDGYAVEFDVEHPDCHDCNGLTKNGLWCSTVYDDEDDLYYIVPLADDNVGAADKQEHYKQSAMQIVEFAQRIMTPEQFDGAMLFNEIKYRVRKDFKGQTDSDINKARQYNYWRHLAKQGKMIDPINDTVKKEWIYNGI